MKFKRTDQKVFVAPKIHEKKKRIRLAVELLLISSVLVGTILGLIRFGEFSFGKTAAKLRSIVSLRTPVLEITNEATFEEKIKKIIDKRILEVASIEKTSEGDFKIRSHTEVVVIISANKDLEIQAKTLQTLLAKAKIENEQVTLVDFRFDKLVVRYKR